MVLIVLVNDQHNEHDRPCGITALFGIFLETNKHQNLMRLSHQVTNKPHNLTRLSHLVTNKHQNLTWLGVDPVCDIPMTSPWYHHYIKPLSCAAHGFEGWLLIGENLHPPACTKSLSEYACKLLNMPVLASACIWLLSAKCYIWCPESCQKTCVWARFIQ